MDKQSESSENKKKRKKPIIFLLVILALLFLCCVISMAMAEPTETDMTDNSEQEIDSTLEVIVSVVPSIEVVITTEVPTVEPTEIDEEDQITNIVSEILKGKNNLDNEKLKEVRITEQFEGGWGVFVGFNASDNLTTNMRKTGIETQMSELYIGLYKSSHDIRRVHITAYFPLTDQYGNTEDGSVYATLLDKAEADKINWDANNTSLKMDIIPGVWTVKSLHDEFR